MIKDQHEGKHGTTSGFPQWELPHFVRLMLQKVLTCTSRVGS